MVRVREESCARVAYDGQVLTYGAYFIESAVDGRDRVRTCVIRFFLEDGTVVGLVCAASAALGVTPRAACFDGEGVGKFQLVKNTFVELIRVLVLVFFFFFF